MNGRDRDFSPGLAAMYRRLEAAISHSDTVEGLEHLERVLHEVARRKVVAADRRGASAAEVVEILTDRLRP